MTYLISTRSSGDPNASDNEMIKKILLFVVDSNNKVEKKVTESLVSTQQQYETEMQLTTGTKTVYGFANLSAENIANAGLDIEEGASMPDLSNATATLANGYTATSDNYIPMSNKTTFTVENKENQTFSLELLRMLCKIKLNFKNETGHTITLKNVVIDPVTTSAVYLLPRLNENTAPELPDKFTTSSYTYNFSESPSFVDGGRLNNFQFYMNESKVLNSGWFKLTLNTLRDGSTEEMRMSLTSLSYLNRNDYLPLDIILTDYKLDVEVMSYPPIGGYPASVTTNADGYHCMFPGGGPFIIIPKLKKLSDGSTIPLTDSDWTFTFTDASTTIFDKVPALKDGEIKGSLKSSATGVALCNISVNVQTSASVTRTLSYKMYISQN
ncbi:fimbrial protein [uncultured Bacteroides sp.]|uniref:fimbrial protein n=1 Tax=uncultured Bacteroides sp. TaxID=162156 RepID=UPI002AABF25D|nr:fimbrial protein [uncultured Bacteroides sp.]